jgi:hypothetical protein
MLFVNIPVVEVDTNICITPFSKALLKQMELASNGQKRLIIFAPLADGSKPMSVKSF